MPLSIEARVQVTEQGIVSDTHLEGHPPGHHERAWSAIEAFAPGRPDARHPEGIYLLLREPPWGDFVWLRAQGSLAVVDALRARGLPERTPAELQAEIDRRRLAELEVEAAALFGAEVWAGLRDQLGDDDPSDALRSPAVRQAVVRLSGGDVARFRDLVRAARLDPRDPLLWAQQRGLV